MIFHFYHELVLSLINGSLLDFWGYKALVLNLLSLKGKQGGRKTYCPHTSGFYFLSLLHPHAQGCFAAQTRVPSSY